MIVKTGLAAVLLVLLGCVAQTEPPDSTPTPTAAGGDRIVGTVRIVGSAPLNVQVVLQPEAGRAVRLVGPLVPELERLAGLEIAVSGRLERSVEPGTDRQLQASGYEILRVNDEPVVWGEIISLSGGWARLRTDSGEELMLSGAPASFRVGHRVWVQGPRTIAVQTFGTIRP
jgi:hypothetical protein